MTNYPGGFPGGVSIYGNVGSHTSGSTYFVDNNSGNDGNNGTSWEDAFKLLSAAIAASNTDISRGSDRWARRNTIFCVGDWIVEDLTTFPNKCDVVGIGSADGRKGCGITGNHTPTASGHQGSRWFNMNFQGTDTTDLVILTSASSGVEFHGCRFLSGGIAPVGAIDATASPFLIINECDFSGSFSGDVIDIGAGAADQTRITNNTIIGGGDNGIVITGVATITATRRGLIANNYISVADKVIDTRATSVFDCINNICISGEALGGSSYVIDLTFAAKNLITGNDVSVGVPSWTTVA